MHVKLFAATLTLLATSAAAYAQPITYTESANASGSLGGVSFTNALVTITGAGDTTAVVGSNGSVYQNFLSLQGTVAGAGSFTFTSTGEFFSGNGAFGASGPGGIDILDTANSASANYDLRSAIGPISGFSAINSGYVFATSAGSFDLTSAGTSTFQATVNAATPEPSSFVLLGSGLLGVAGAMRRRYLAR